VRQPPPVPVNGEVLTSIYAVGGKTRQVSRPVWAIV